MFRKRNSRKPAEDFYLDFRKSYSHIGPSTGDAPATPIQSSNTLNNTLGMSLPTSIFDGQDDGKDHAMDSMSDWKLDPASYLDQEEFANYTGYWPPTPDVNGGSAYPGRDDTYNQNMTSGLHMITGLETPLSRPVTNSAFDGSQSGSLTMNDFLPSQYHPPNLFNNYHSYQGDHTTFNHSLSSNNLHNQHTLLFQDVPHLDHSASTQSMEAPQKFRFRVNLLTATAMIKNSDEIPLTYLNKCQAYKLSIKDVAPEQTPAPMTRYRTFIRISFDDEQQRERPGHCWQLWKEGRGMNEAHQRGGKLQAVEFVPPPQGQSNDRPASIELLSEAFDGFCIAWTPTYPGQPECELQLRFNFLSTDFSHSKGVKGIPVRLCAKTEVLCSTSNMAPPSPAREVCYCKVKLFRDHGAERKIANDEAHVKKNIEKLTQQIGQAQTVLTEGGKRRRSDSTSGNQRPTKLAKHKRASSVSSSSSNSVRDAAEDDLHAKLASLNAMLRSRKTESRLNLDGDEQDDPDLFPVTMQGSMLEPSSAIDSPEHARLERRSTQMTGTSAGSPTLSTVSAGSPRRRNASLQCPTPLNSCSRAPSNESRNNMLQLPKSESRKSSQHLASPSDAPIKVEKSQKDGEADTNQWLEALGVDKGYQPPPVNNSKPVACFYIQPKVGGKLPEDSHYRAVYLRQRTLQDFVQAVAKKCNVGATQVANTVHVNAKGLRIKVDDEMLLEIPEGQDMQVEFESSTTPLSSDNEASESPGGLSAKYTLTLRF